MATKSPHILITPFPAAGHIIPMLDLTHQFLTRGVIVTVLITPNNLPLLQPLLSTHPLSLHPLLLTPPNGDPFMNIPKSADDALANIRTFGDLHAPVVKWFASHDSPPKAIVSDFLFGWTHAVASQLGLPRIVFSPSGVLSTCVSECIWRDLPKKSGGDGGEGGGGGDGDDFLVCLDGVVNSPIYPWWQLSHFYRSYKEGDPDWEFFRNGMISNSASWGIVFNSFTELERVYLEHVKKELGHDRVWCVGPLLPPSDDDSSRGGSNSVLTHEVMVWLDQWPARSVVYICFGSRTVLTRKQLDALAAGLQASEVRFILSVKEIDEERYIDLINSDKGFVIRGWAAQVPILRHKAVGAFVTHCGWNSVLEGISAGVVLLTWPMDADQFTGASLLVDELGVGIRFGEGTRNIPKPNKLAQILADSLDVNKPEKARASELSDAAMAAVKGGSSERHLNDLVMRLSAL